MKLLTAIAAAAISLFPMTAQADDRVALVMNEYGVFSAATHNTASRSLFNCLSDDSTIRVNYIIPSLADPVCSEIYLEDEEWLTLLNNACANLGHAAGTEAQLKCERIYVSFD